MQGYWWKSGPKAHQPKFQWALNGPWCWSQYDKAPHPPGPKPILLFLELSLLVKMAVKYAKIDRVDSFGANFQQVTVVQIF